MYEAGSDFGFECVNSLSYEQCSLDVSGTESVRDQMKPITILFNAKYKPYSCSGYLCRFTIIFEDHESRASPTGTG